MKKTNLHSTKVEMRLHAVEVSSISKLSTALAENSALAVIFALKVQSFVDNAKR